MHRIQGLMRDPRISGAGGLATAGLAAALLILLALPIITRLYSPEQYAAYALALALSTLLATLVSGRYEMGCVVAPHDAAGDREAWKLARLALLASATCASVLQVVATIIARMPGDVGFSDTRFSILFLPLLTFLAATVSIQTLLDTRLGNYKLIASLTAGRAALLSGSQILLGLIVPSAASLLAALMLSLTPNLARLLYLLTRASPGSDRSSFLQLAIRHRRYPQFQIWAALANSLSFSFFVLVLAFSYGEAIVGLFAIASRIVLFPTSIVAGPVNTVYFREAARLANLSEVGAVAYRKVVLLLSIIGLAIYAAIAAFTPIMVSVLGSDWQASQSLIYASIPMGFALFIGAPANSSLIVCGRQALLLLWRIVLVGLGPAFILLGPIFGASGTTAVAIASLGLLIGTTAYAGSASRVFRSAQHVE